MPKNLPDHCFTVAGSYPACTGAAMPLDPTRLGDRLSTLKPGEPKSVMSVGADKRLLSQFEFPPTTTITDVPAVTVYQSTDASVHLCHPQTGTRSSQPPNLPAAPAFHTAFKSAVQFQTGMQTVQSLCTSWKIQYLFEYNWTDIEMTHHLFEDFLQNILGQKFDIDCIKGVTLLSPLTWGLICSSKLFLQNNINKTGIM